MDLLFNIAKYDYSLACDTGVYSCNSTLPSHFIRISGSQKPEKKVNMRQVYGNSTYRDFERDTLVYTSSVLVLKNKDIRLTIYQDKILVNIDSSLYSADNNGFRKIDDYI